MLEENNIIKLLKIFSKEIVIFFVGICIGFVLSGVVKIYLKEKSMQNCRNFVVEQNYFCKEKEGCYITSDGKVDRLIMFCSDLENPYFLSRLKFK